MRKKTSGALLAVAAGLLTFMGAGCWEEKELGENLEFDVAAELEASINSVYELPVVIATLGGREYVADVVIKDSEGKEISLSGNSFFVDSFDGYKAVFSVSVNGVNYNKQVAIKVGDFVPPVLKLDTPDYVSKNIGEIFTIPTDKITATDNSGEEVDISYSVSFDGNAVEINEVNAFAIGEEGEYLITITATDKKGNEAKETIVVEGRARGLICGFEKEKESNSVE
ncbi:MAG: hypothetical protein ACI4SH_08925, partial [Candidatus Scatosoma sp.]